MRRLSPKERAPVKRLVFLIPVLLVLAVVPSAFAGLRQPSRQGVSTASRSVPSRCWAYRDHHFASSLVVGCRSRASATLRYRFTVPRSAHGIWSIVQYSWRGRGVSKRLTRSGRRVTVAVHVPASSEAEVLRVWIRYYS